MIRRRSALVAGIAAGLVLFTGPAAFASNVEHINITLPTETSVNPIGAEGAACVGYAGTITEVRTSTLTGIVFVSGPNAGEERLRLITPATFQITPATPGAGPTYTGTYVERAVFNGRTVNGEDVPRANTYVLNGRATGSDGSELRLHLHGHTTITPNGAVHGFDRLSC